MDEADYLQILQEDPGNDGVRREYYEWLARNRPARSDFVRLMNERARVERKLAALDEAIAAHPVQSDPRWLDEVFPLLVRSHCIGLFRSSPRPNEPPSVTAGTRVLPSTVVCLIEALGLFNEVVAGHSGEIVKCFVEDGPAIEWQQVLFKIARPLRQDAYNWLDFW